MIAVVPPRQNRKFPSLITSSALIVGFLITGAPPAAAQLLPDARVIEWDCPLMGEEAPTPPADPAPGALVAEGPFVWYVTRVGQQRLVRFTPGSPIATGLATCNWWDLAPVTVTTGGLRLRPVGTQAFIRTLDDLQRIETTINRRTRWLDGMFTFSDVAVLSNASTSVFTTGFTVLEVGTVNERGNDVVQRFVPSSNGAATATRWEVGGGAGSIYLSGIDGHPTSSNLIYFSQPGDNQIGELDTTTGVVRRWNLSDPVLPPGVLEPRQLDVAFGGMVWVVTGSGHLVRLNPTTNEILVATIPGIALNNPFGIDADGVIGFTAAGGIPGFEKVGMLFPDGTTSPVTPTSEMVFSETVTFTECVIVPPNTDPTPPCFFAPETIPQFTGPASPVVKNAPATETDDIITGGGTFFEVMIDAGVAEDAGDCTGTPPEPDFGLPTDPCAPSTQPLGIASDPNGGVGSYFAAIGLSILRIAHVSIPTEAAGIVTLGGWIETSEATALPGTTSTGKGSFGGVAMRKRIGDPVKGHITYQNHLTGDKVISLELTDLTFADNKAVIGGACKAPTSDCMDFRVDATDNGQPNRTPRDMFEIVKDPLLGLGGTAADGGPLQGGNIKIRRQN